MHEHYCAIKIKTKNLKRKRHLSLKEKDIIIVVRVDYIVEYCVW